MVIGLAIAMQYLDYRGALSQWEGWFLDIAYVGVRGLSLETQVIMVEIEDEAYEQVLPFLVAVRSQVTS